MTSCSCRLEGRIESTSTSTVTTPRGAEITRNTNAKTNDHFLLRHTFWLFFSSLNWRRILDWSPGVVGQVRKTLIDRVLKQEEGPYKTSISRSVTLLPCRFENVYYSL